MVTVDAPLARALEAFALEPLSPPAPVEEFRLNENYRVETASRVVFLRGHGPNRPFERIQREHAGANWVAGRGLPIAEVLTTPSGQSIVEIDGRFWTAYAWVEGWTYRRGETPVDGANALGLAHGRCLAALRDYPAADTLPTNSEITWSTEFSIDVLESIADEVAARGTGREKHWHPVQVELLRTAGRPPEAAFTALPMVATHGDFHERNVMFDAAGNLAAVVDWERFCQQPPVFEVLRGASFMWLMDPDLLRAYLEGIRDHAPLDPAAVRPGIDAWWQSAMHNTWAFRAGFRDGNDEVRRFLVEEEDRVMQFHDPVFREWLAETMLRFGC